MNWKKHAHLFANGKFGILLDGEELGNHKEWEITGINEEFFHIQKRPVKSHNDLNYVEISRCQLLARPISDMTDEEVKDIAGNSLMGKEAIKGYRELLIEYAEIERLCLSDARYLLSIGVYPLSQNDFSKSVIDITEIE